MNRPVTALLTLLVGGLIPGCGFLDSAEQYTNTVATEVLLVGVVNPVKSYVDIEDQVAMTVFVADVRQVSSLDRIADAPVTGAEVRVKSGELASELTEADSGLYYALSTTGSLVYTAGATYEAAATASGETYKATAEAPEPTGFEEDRSCVSAGAALTLNLTGGPFERVVVAVYDQDGNQTYSNLPEDSDGLVDFLTADDAGSTFALPATAFPDADQVYGVAVAGLEELGSFSDNVNPLLSRYFVGAGRVGLIGTYTSQDLCAQLASAE